MPSSWMKSGLAGAVIVTVRSYWTCPSWQIIRAWLIQPLRAIWTSIQCEINHQTKTLMIWLTWKLHLKIKRRILPLLYHYSLRIARIITRQWNPLTLQSSARSLAKRTYKYFFNRNSLLSNMSKVQNTISSTKVKNPVNLQINFHNNRNN